LKGGKLPLFIKEIIWHLKATKKTKGKSDKITVKSAIGQSSQNNNARQSRLNFRLAPNVKERVARAAALSGQDLTEFAVATLSEKADLVIERHDNLLLGSDEHDFFLKALSESGIAEPSERSRAAAEKYRQGIRKGVRHNLAD
jgi:uncharacterized protein (DUF1778 family)